MKQKTNYDLELLKATGFCHGIENYSRHLSQRPPGSKPICLLDYFQDDYILFIDESHISIPQIRGMYEGDKSRKQTLVDYGFRLPSALDNRPLQFTEFLTKVRQTIYVSATPGEWEIDKSRHEVIEQLVRPTGLVDPEIDIRPIEGQIENLTKEIIDRKNKGQRVLVTTLTKRLAEALTDYLNDENHIRQFYPKPQEALIPKVAYLHSDIDTLDRQDILDDLRKGVYDVLVGINLLREGLDLPEVTLVAILDADKEGFLRSRTSLIQTMGRAARHVEGRIIMYADTITRSMQAAIEEVSRRRQIQLEYNLTHGITPTSIQKAIKEKLIERTPEEKDKKQNFSVRLTPKGEDLPIEAIKRDDYTPQDLELLIKRLRKAMLVAAKALDFEKAAKIRDKIQELQS